MSRILQLLPALLVALSLSSDAQAQIADADIVVFGGTPGGISAAVGAARMGRSVILVEPSPHVGGMISGGLGYSDVCRKTTVGGLARDFFVRVAKRYKKKGFHYNFEAKVGESILSEMLARAKVTVVTNERLQSVSKSGGHISEIQTETGKKFRARVFIDGTYEGDLLAKAGVSYTFGREAKSEFNEELAGVRPYSTGRQFNVPVSAYDANGKLLPGIQETKLAPLGSGDKKVMAYNFRLCMTTKDDNMIPVTKPANYDPREYELLARYLEHASPESVREILLFHEVTPEKVCLNRNGPFSTNFIGENWGWPDGTYAERDKIYERHKQYTQGVLYFLWNDPRVPQDLQRKIKPWGYCKDEFQDNGNWPHQLYVREARRMRGEYVLSEKDLVTERYKDDVIGLASCPIEIHEVQRVVKEDGFVANEGFTFQKVQGYAIPYRSLLPKASEADNLLVPVAVSATHVAYSSLRMEPVYMILGQSAGVAAAMAVQGGTTVQAVDIKQLQATLRKQSQVL